MRFLYVFSILCMTVFAQNSLARSPAVLDFVGIEHETFKYQRVPSAANSNLNKQAFNFEHKDYSQYQNSQLQESAANSFTFSTFATLLFLLCLPFATWLAVKVKMDNKANEHQQLGLDIISKYREIKKNTSELNDEVDKDDHDDISKAS